MKIFSYLYNKTLLWSCHRHAPYYLASVSFAESSFFPVPPDVMLVSMGLAVPKNAWRYALIATMFSAIGGAFGYLIGMYGAELLHPYILSHYGVGYSQVIHWFKTYGVWVVFLAGFSPVPYKLFTIAAGALQMAFMPFLLASLLGRGCRFFLVATLLYFFGERVEIHLRKYVDIIGWSVVLIFVIVYFLMKWLF